MTKAALVRLIASGFIAFFSYAAWAYYANSLVTNDTQILVKAALVQGGYSGIITLVFTFLLEASYKRFGTSSYCLSLIVPRISAHSSVKHLCITHQTFQNSQEELTHKCKGKCLPGMLFSPLPALFIQSVMVISVNIIFMTPNLWLTVAPSIVFSAIYGYMYSFALSRKKTTDQ